jgi:nucleoside-diphosphate-sugar epimerase
VVNAVLNNEPVTLHGNYEGKTDSRAWLHAEDCAGAINFLLDYPIVKSTNIDILLSKEENKYRFDQFWDIFFIHRECEVV